MFDVIAVNIDNGKIEIFGENKDKLNADAIVKMAVIRRGCDEQYYRVVPAGQYHTGDTYQPSTSQS